MNVTSKSLTVADLIEKLERFNPDLPVVVPGFDEANWDDVTTGELIWIKRDLHGSGHWNYRDAKRNEEGAFPALSLEWPM